MNRPSLLVVYMKFARDLATRSTCARSQVGTVITSRDHEQVLAIGYNGNAKGLPNNCDRDEPGNCGCIHSEMNALVKCGKGSKDKVMFTTLSPCAICAKLVINSGFLRVFYNEEYRKPDGIIMLRDCGVAVEQLAV